MECRKCGPLLEQQLQWEYDYVPIVYCILLDGKVMQHFYYYDDHGYFNEEGVDGLSGKV